MLAKKQNKTRQRADVLFTLYPFRPRPRSFDLASGDGATEDGIFRFGNDGSFGVYEGGSLMNDKYALLIGRLVS